jgi:tellurite methyltransferase
MAQSVIEKYRKKKGMTQQELADKLGATRQVIWKWETKRSTPTIQMCEKLAKALAVGVTKIMKDYTK